MKSHSWLPNLLNSVHVGPKQPRWCQAVDVAVHVRMISSSPPHSFPFSRTNLGHVRHCLEPRDSWWAHDAAATHGVDCVEQHMHSLLWSVFVVLEAIELVSEVKRISFRNRGLCLPKGVTYEKCEKV